MERMSDLPALEYIRPPGDGLHDKGNGLCLWLHFPCSLQEGADCVSALKFLIVN